MSNLGRQIEAFRAVMLTGGMTAAAETLHVTQPAVSRLIRDLEADLKVGLFHRRGNQITPTTEALAFFSEVERSYLGLEQLKGFAADLRHSVIGSLRIASLPAMAFGFLPYCLATFSSTRPKLSLLLDGIPSHLVVERVLSGQFDLGFVEVPAERPMLKVVPLKAQAVAVVPQDHRLAQYETISAEEFRDENFITLARGSYIRHMIERAIGGSGGANRTIETPLAAIACSMVAQGLGVSIVEPFSAVGYVNRGLVVRRLEPAIDVGFAMVTDQHRPLSRVAEDFASRIQSMADTFLEPLNQ